MDFIFLNKFLKSEKSKINKGSKFTILSLYFAYLIKDLV